MKRTGLGIILLVLMTSQVSFSSAVVPWEVGQIITYELTWESKTIIQREYGTSPRSSSLIERQRYYNITAINETDLNLTFIIFEKQPKEDIYKNRTSVLSYNSTFFGSQLGDFSATYLKFSHNNSYYLNSFSTPNYAPILIEPDFRDVADNFKEELNASKIIDPNMDFPLSRYTLGNLFDSMKSWSINGGTIISEAKDAITDETKEYTMEFDLSGVLINSYSKLEGSVHVAVYVPYYVANISLNWVYDSDGILQSYSEHKIYSYLENYNTTITNDNSYTIKQPRGISLDALTGIEIYLGVSLLWIVVYIIYVSFKNKRNRN